MPFRELMLFLLVSLIFAAGNVLARYMIAYWDIPPLFYGAWRYLIASIVLAYLLLPMPKPRVPLIVGTLLLGALAFGLYNVALKYADASSAAVVSLAQAPIGVLLAMMLLAERVSARRILGTLVTLSGVALVVYRPGGFEVSHGLWIVLGSSFCSALGMIVCRKLAGIAPIRVQAWSALLCFLVLAPASALTEQGQFDAAMEAGWRFIAAVLFMGLIVSVVVLPLYLRFLQRYDSSLMAALGLLAPLLTVVLGVLVLGETISRLMLVGMMVTIAGVLIITYSTRRSVNGS